MADERFITRPLSLWLDLVRGLAALVVLVGHGVQSKLYTGPWPFSILLQHNAVTVFFVLSGLVIATSVDGRPGSLRDYAIARASRILPVALPAIVLSVLLAAISHELLPATDGKPPLRPMQTALATVFLSESFGPGWALNAPYWSLCYEVWFYALFGAWTYLRGKARLAWTAGLALVAGANILLLLPIWLTGVLLARDPAAKVADPVRGASFLVGGLIVFSLASRMSAPVLDALMPHYPWNLGYALYAPTDLLLGLAVAACFIGLRPLAALAPDALTRFERPIRWLAGCSFSIYLFHAPVAGTLLYLLALFVTAWRSTAAFILVLAPSIIAVLYSIFRLKKYYIVKNLMVGSAWGMTPLVVGFYFGQFSLAILALSIFFALEFFVNTVIFDIKDIKGDHLYRIATLPTVIGPKSTRHVCMIVSIFSGIILMMSIFSGMLPVRAIVLIPFLAYVFAYTMLSAKRSGVAFYGLTVDGEFAFLAVIIFVVSLVLGW